MTKMTERAIEPVLERSRKRSGKLIAIMNQMSHKITKQRWLAGTGVSWRIEEHATNAKSKRDGGGRPTDSWPRHCRWGSRMGFHWVNGCTATQTFWTA